MCFFLSKFYLIVFEICTYLQVHRHLGIHTLVLYIAFELSSPDFLIYSQRSHLGLSYQDHFKKLFTELNLRGSGRLLSQSKKRIYPMCPI